MHIDVVAFAALRDALGGSRFRIDLERGANGTALREILAARHPRWQDLIRSCRLARGVRFLNEDEPLEEGDEVAMIPPVSGGRELPAVLLTRDPLDAASLEASARSKGTGAVVLFEGVVRSPSLGKDVLHLEYEAYEAMAEDAMERIVLSARSGWPVTTVFLHHRLGRIGVGDTSVVALAASAHREEAFAACRHLIERLKHDVPIWKKEVFSDGSVWVGAPGECAHEPES